MNDIKQYFSSPTKLVATPNAPALDPKQTTTKTNNVKTPRESLITPNAEADKSSAVDSPCSSSISSSSKQIVSNMASVISSVEKQQKAKRKREVLKKRKQRNLAEPEISNISNILSNNLHFVSPTNAAGSKKETEFDVDMEGIELLEVVDVDGDPDKQTAKSPKSPLIALVFGSPSRKSTSNTSISSDRSSKENKSTHSRSTNHRTPSKATTTPKKKTLFTASVPVANAPSSSSSKPKNAFELMMSARNKSIGGNSPGKDSPSVDVSPNAESPSTSSAGTTKTKRKLMLEEWAERKGGAKRKIQEADAEEYVNHQMKKRAKRLRKLLANGRSSKDCDNDDEDDDGPVIEVFVDEEESQGVITPSSVSLKLNFKKITPKSNGKRKRSGIKIRVIDSDDDDDDEDDDSHTDNYEELPPETIEVPTGRLAESKTPPGVAAKLPTSTKTPTKSPRRPLVNRRKSHKTPTKSPRPPKSPSGHGKICDLDLVLSSPIKKRDSLLGYFTKIDKSPTSAVAEDSHQPSEIIPDDDVEVITIVRKRKGRPPKSKSITRESTPTPPCVPVGKKKGRPPKSQSSTPTTTTTRESSPTPSCAAADKTETPTDDNHNGRARRGCRDKSINYMENSPAKVAAQRSLKRACRLLSGGCSPQKSPVKAQSRPGQKLAPIFVKASLKPLIDPEVTKARFDFLMSGIPERMKLDLERQRLFEQSYECELDLFPAISHVTQLPTRSLCPADQDTVPNIPFRSLDKSDIPNPTTYRLGSKATSSLPTPAASPNPEDLKLTRPKELVKLLKDNDSGRFLYFRCYKQLRKKFNDDQEDASLSKPYNGNNDHISFSSHDDSVEFVEPSFGNRNGTEMFTEKYKPTTPEEIVVNSAPAYQLKKYLSAWQENYQKQNSKSKRHYDSSNDDDDFEIDSNSTAGLSKAIVLLGPTGNGKTNAVYALAQEMNFNVLEINAGSKRNGKKMLLELQEATQSHQVKGGGGSDCRMFRGSQTQTAMLQSSEESSSGNSSQSAQKLSLILIEDSDIVFEQDNGFVEAMYQLVATSKRPVILVANQRTCSHLTRFAGSNAIVFAKADPVHAGKWLSMLSIAERRYVGHEECTRLYVHNGCDMRRTILELQFFLQSGGDRRLFDSPDETHYLHQSLYESFTRNHNEEEIVSHPVSFDSIHDKTRDILRTDDDARSMAEVLEYYDAIAAAQYIQRVGCVDDDCLRSNLGNEISHYMVEGAISKMQSSKFHLDPPVKQPLEKARNLLAPSIYVGPPSATHITRRRSINLDVEPCLRSICRSEKIRTQVERRSSRFYHYLRNAMTSSFSTDGFDEHCGVLTDDPIQSDDLIKPSNS